MTTKPYTTMVGDRADKYARVDIERFATDLCAAMGGTGLNIEKGDERASFMLGFDKITLHTSRWNTKPEVTVHLDTPDVSDEDRKFEGDRATERASVNPDARAIERIAADVRRRVVEGSAEATKWRRDKAAKFAGIRQCLADLTPALTQLGLEVTPETGSNGLRLRALGREPNLLSIRVTHEAFEINRACDLSLDQLRRIVAIVNEKP